MVYINPPYAEASNARTASGTGENRPQVSDSYIKNTYKTELGRAANELFAQFYVRIVKELSGAYLGMFSTLKILQGPNFKAFRSTFKIKLIRLFIVPGYTFDNVTGQFPVAFQLYKTDYYELFDSIVANVYDEKGMSLPDKLISAYNNDRYIIEWLRNYYERDNKRIAYLRFLGTDFQNNDGVFITLQPSANDLKQVKGNWITPNNIIPFCIYFAVRKVVEHHWSINQDQYLYPKDEWIEDSIFQANCMVYALFHDKNRISSEHGTNHWIPFTEEEVGAQEMFESHFMSDYLQGKHTPSKTPICAEGELFAEGQDQTNAPMPQKLQFSPEARAVMDAGRELWRYYHEQPIAKEHPNASFYDIRLYFQGTKTTKSGKQQMNTESTDATYTSLITNLRQKQKELAKRIEPKVYEYGFLKK